MGNRFHSRGLASAFAGVPVRDVPACSCSHTQRSLPLCLIRHQTRPSGLQRGLSNTCFTVSGADHPRYPCHSLGLVGRSTSFATRRMPPDLPAYWRAAAASPAPRRRQHCSFRWAAVVPDRLEKVLKSSNPCTARYCVKAEASYAGYFAPFDTWRVKQSPFQVFREVTC